MQGWGYTLACTLESPPACPPAHLPARAQFHLLARIDACMLSHDMLVRMQTGLLWRNLQRWNVRPQHSICGGFFFGPL